MLSQPYLVGIVFDQENEDCFHGFLQANDFETINTKITELTFIHPDGKDKSTTDFFFIFKLNLKKKVVTLKKMKVMLIAYQTIIQ